MPCTGLTASKKVFPDFCESIFLLFSCSLEQQLQETKRQFQARQTEREQCQGSATISSILHSAIPSTTTTLGATTSQSSKRESSAPPAPTAGRTTVEERGREDVAGGQCTARQGMVQREQMEQAIFNDPLQISSVQTFAHTTSTAVASSGGSSVLFHNSYHGETAEQLRNRSRPAWDGPARQFTSPGVTSYSGVGTTASSANKAVHPSPPTSVIQSPTPPHFVPSPSPSTTAPQIPTVTNHSPSLHHQPISQEWTEYTSAPSDGSQGSVPLSPPPHTNQGSSSTPDVSEFDPIHS